LESYLRYAEGFTQDVRISIDDPVASPHANYYRVVVHLSRGPQKKDVIYYTGPDGQRLINGTIWSLGESPFLDTLERLPTNGPSFGPATAKVTMVIFSDFQCPYCRKLASTVRENIPKKYPADVRVVFEDFPIDSIHKWARAAAEAAHCIGDGNPDAFWAFHDWIFEHQQEVNETNVREKVLGYAKEKNLDSSKIASCLDAHATAQEVTSTEERGTLLQITQTPTLFINGRMAPGALPWDQLDALIKLELARPQDIRLPAGPPCCEVTIPAATKK
jgi:protein-disulfide isomerase